MMTCMLKNSLALGIFATVFTSQAFASGSPVLTCYDLSAGSRLAFYFSLDNDDSLSNPTHYTVSGAIDVQEVTDNAGNTDDLGTLTPASEKDVTGDYVFQDDKGNPVQQKLTINFKGVTGTTLSITAEGSKEPKSQTSMYGRMSYNLLEKAQPKLVSITSHKDTRVRCEYSWN